MSWTGLLVFPFLFIACGVKIAPSPYLQGTASRVAPDNPRPVTPKPTPFSDEETLGTDKPGKPGKTSP